MLIKSMKGVPVFGWLDGRYIEALKVVEFLLGL
jgi:hypothetical protein